MDLFRRTVIVPQIAKPRKGSVIVIPIITVAIDPNRTRIRLTRILGMGRIFSFKIAERMAKAINQAIPTHAHIRIGGNSFQTIASVHIVQALAGKQKSTSMIEMTDILTVFMDILFITIIRKIDQQLVHESYYEMN